MKIKARMMIGFAALAVAATLSGTASAQHAQVQPRDKHVTARAAAYDPSREVIVQGTVLKYSDNSTARPMGAHVAVQTPSGTVDVHLGPSSYLHANNFSFSPGDAVRFVGAMSSTSSGNVFLARIAQKGSQAIAIRSTQGFLLAPGAARTLPSEQRAQAAQKVGAR